MLKLYAATTDMPLDHFAVEIDADGKERLLTKGLLAQGIRPTSRSRSRREPMDVPDANLNPGVITNSTSSREDRETPLKPAQISCVDAEPTPVGLSALGQSSGRNFRGYGIP